MSIFPKIFAHRGLSSKAPENTMAAFKKALEYDIDGVEFDVQMTKDNRLVVIHDEKIDRTTTGSGYVKDFTYEELSVLDAGEWFSKEYAGERIPLLEDTLKLFMNRNIIINIELKNSLIEYEGLEESVLKSVREYKLEDRTVISSFNHYSIKKIRDLNLNIKTAVLCCDILYEPSEYLKSVGANYVHTSIEAVNSELVQHLHKNGIGIRCYTVNNEEELNRMTTLGVDGIFTDRADEMIRMINK